MIPIEAKHPRASTPLDRLSLVLFIAMHVACLLGILYPPTWKLAILATASYIVRMWAITVGYHRYFAHHSFKAGRVFQLILGILGTTAMQNGPLWWASWHRRHHKHADEAGDPHSPRQLGFFRAHLGWIFDGQHGDPELANVGDLTRFPELRVLERYNWVPLVASAVGCYFIAGVAGVVWGFVISTIVLDHVTMLINSMAHVWGTRRYDTADDSRNNALLAFLTLGEGWHNNHHHYMSSARQGVKAWEVDVSFYSIRVLSWLGVVWDVRLPPGASTRQRPLARKVKPVEP